MNGVRKHFFSGVHNPATASDIITSLAAGHPLEVGRLPMDAVPAVLLLAAIGLRRFDQQIVDDYVLLIETMKELFREFWHDKYWHPELNAVSGIVNEGPASNYDFLDGVPEVAYIFDLYQELVNAELKELFPASAFRSEAEPEPAKANGSKKRRAGV